MRDAIFIGYRMHSGGRWTGQYQLIDAEAYTHVERGIGRLAYVHSVSEIYIPGSAADDPEVFPTFPVAEGVLRERLAESETPETDSAVESRNLDELQTEHYETLVSSGRERSQKTKETLLRTRGALMPRWTAI